MTSNGLLLIYSIANGPDGKKLYFPGTEFLGHLHSLLCIATTSLMRCSFRPLPVQQLIEPIPRLAGNVYSAVVLLLDLLLLLGLFLLQSILECFQATYNDTKTWSIRKRYRDRK